MWYKFKKFTNLSAEEKKIFLEAYITLGKMRVAILTLSFKRLTHSLVHNPKELEVPLPSEKEVKIAMKVSQAISRAAAYTPWESACLVQSLTAQRMLQKRGIPGVFYLGVAKDEKNREKIKAHAWSQCGESIITGAAGHEAFTVLSVFGWKRLGVTM